MRRKTFLSLFPAMAALGCAANRSAEAPPSASPDLPTTAPTGPDDEAWWGRIRAQFELPEDWINFENGYFCQAARPVLAAQRRRLQHINDQAAHYMRTEQEPAREGVRERLAAFAAVDPEEIALVRNTTEAMNVALLGQRWSEDDEVIMSDQDYGSMDGILKWLERRRGVKLKVVKVPLQPSSDDEIVDAYTAPIGPKTRLALITQVINLTGQVLPATKLCAAFRAAGVKTVVDGAHAFAQLPGSIGALDCDYYGTSLHKWLGAPLGNGLLWMRREHVPVTDPLFADVDRATTDVRRFEHIGTRPMHDLETIVDAIEFHEAIGTAHKRARLLHLRQRWVKAVAEQPKIRLASPLDDARACSIATVGVEGMSPPELAAALWDDHRIYTVAIVHPVVQGVRITPHLHTSVAEADRLADALRAIASAA
jgi:selenocysteine lyase/cysteine desulfurase